MYLANVTNDYDDITSSNYTDYDILTLSNCTNSTKIDIIIPTLLFKYQVAYHFYV